MGLRVWGLIGLSHIPHIYVVSLQYELFEEDHSSGWTSCHMCSIWMLCLEGRLFDGLELVIPYWSLYHTAHISKISLQCCPHSNCWGLRHDWSPSYTGHIYTDPPWGEWAHQQEGRSSDWSTQHIPDICRVSPLGWLSGGFAYVSSDSSPSHTHYTYGAPLLLAAAAEVQDQSQGWCLFHSHQRSDILSGWCYAGMCSLQSLFHNYDGQMPSCFCVLPDHHGDERSFSWLNDHTATVYFLRQFADTYSDNSDFLRFIFLQKSQEVWIWGCWLLTLLELFPWSFPTQFSSSATSADSPTCTQEEELTSFSNLDLFFCRPIIESWVLVNLFVNCSHICLHIRPSCKMCLSPISWRISISFWFLCPRRIKNSEMKVRTGSGI